VINMEFAIASVIRVMGETISVIKYSDNLDDDMRTYFTPSSTITARALVYAARGYRESWEQVGYFEDVDYVMSTYSTLNIEPRDHVVLRNGERCEVVEVVPRRTGVKVDYLEVLLRRIRD